MRAWCAVMALGMVLLGSRVCQAQSVQVTPLTRDGRVLVSWRMTDVFTDDVRAAIHSGMTITFIYDIDLKRAATLWLDRTIASATVTATVKYDNLTRRYQLTRKEDGRIDSLAIVDYKTAADEDRQYDPQLQVYTDAGRREGLDVRAAYIHDLKGAKRATVDVSPAAVKRSEDEVVQLVERLKKKDFSPAPATKKCSSCDVRPMCRHAV